MSERLSQISQVRATRTDPGAELGAKPFRVSCSRRLLEVTHLLVALCNIASSGVEARKHWVKKSGAAQQAQSEADDLVTGCDTEPNMKPFSSGSHCGQCRLKKIF